MEKRQMRVSSRGRRPRWDFKMFNNLKIYQKKVLKKKDEEHADNRL